jgi:hypothetical protein
MIVDEQGDVYGDGINPRLDLKALPIRVVS